MRAERVVIASGSPEGLKQLRTCLKGAGCRVIKEAQDGMGALRVIHTIQPDLIVADFQLAGVDGLELAKVCEEERIAPVLLLVSNAELPLVRPAMDTWVFNCLVRPFNETQLFVAIEVAESSFQRLIRLEEEVRKLKTTLAARKIVDKAKGILMRNLGISEEEAHKRMQRQAMNRRVSMQELARAIILSDEMGKDLGAGGKTS